MAEQLRLRPGRLLDHVAPRAGLGGQPARQHAAARDGVAGHDVPLTGQCRQDHRVHGEQHVRRHSLPRQRSRVLGDARYGREEGIAIERVLHGWRAEGVPDRKLLERGMELIEGLYRGLA